MSFHNTFDDAAMTLKFQNATLLLKCHYSLDERVDLSLPQLLFKCPMFGCSSLFEHSIYLVWQSAWG